MNKHSMMSRLTALALVILLTLGLLSGCKTKVGEPVSVTINDNGNIVVAEGRDSMTVKMLLKEADISLGAHDEVTPELNAVWKKANAQEITIRRSVTVTVTDGSSQKTVELVGGTVADAISASGFSTVGFTVDPAPSSALSNGMVITLNKVTDGLVTNEDKTYYYMNGEPQKNAVVTTNEGTLYANADGEINRNYCGGVNIDGQDWIVINGAAQKVETEFDKTLFAAAKDIDACTTTDMTKDEKLKAAFDYIKTHYLEGVLHDPPYQEPDWHIVCANDLFVYGKGDCFSYGAAFAFYAKAIGCSDVYASNSGGHGWAEAEGKAYDPEWSMHSDAYTYFAVAPGDEVDVAYWTTTSDADWKHIKL